MINLKDIHWDRHLVQMVELRYYTPMVCHMGLDMERLRELHW